MYRKGDWKAVCDVCGLEFWASELKEDYWNRRVDAKCFETRHPQEFVRAKEEKGGTDWSRPATDTQEISTTTLTNSIIEYITASLTDNFIHVTIAAGELGTVALPLMSESAHNGVDPVYSIHVHEDSGESIQVVAIAPNTIVGDKRFSGTGSLTHLVFQIRPGETARYRGSQATNVWTREI